MKKLVEFAGAAQFGEAILAVQDPRIDLAVVRAGVGLAAVAALLDPSTDPYDVLLGEHLPLLSEGRAVTEKVWSDAGYLGFDIDELPTFDRRLGGIGAHVDTGANARHIPAISMSSVCLRKRTFAAERLPGDFSGAADHHTGGRRTFDWRAFRSAYGPDTPFDTAVQSRTPRTQAELEPGDVAVFAEHPAIVLHQAMSLSKDQLRPAALLLGWWATRE